MCGVASWDGFRIQQIVWRNYRLVEAGTNAVCRDESGAADVANVANEPVTIDELYLAVRRLSRIVRRSSKFTCCHDIAGSVSLPKQRAVKLPNARTWEPCGLVSSHLHARYHFPLDVASMQDQVHVVLGSRRHLLDCIAGAFEHVLNEILEFSPIKFQHALLGGRSEEPSKSCSTRRVHGGYHCPSPSPP